jgi:hypothetical protein
MKIGETGRCAPGGVLVKRTSATTYQVLDFDALNRFFDNRTQKLDARAKKFAKEIKK